MAKAKKQQQQASVTYTGDQDSLNYAGYEFKRGEAVDVDEKTARFLRDNDYFEVSGLSAEDPASSVAPEDALAAERAAHQTEIDTLNAEHAKAMQDQADSLKAGWKEQYDELVAENEALKAQLGTQQKEQLEQAQQEQKPQEQGQ